MILSISFADRLSLTTPVNKTSVELSNIKKSSLLICDLKGENEDEFENSHFEYEEEIISKLLDEFSKYMNPQKSRHLMFKLSSLIADSMLAGIYFEFLGSYVLICRN